ncbi:MAG TPA: flagellar M-ring protein FliF [Verrucomicrobiales bacterium]|nr:flagellar M-ring protein FliF [Verrucomicrobiales bacterium]
MNQNLKQLGKQLIDIWKQLGMNQRVSVVLAAVVVLAGLGALTLFSSRMVFEPLFHGLEPADSAKVVAALEADKIPYRSSAGGTTILVPRDKVDSMRVKLSGTITSGSTVGDEILENPSVMMSDALQRAMLERARNGELARMIMTFDDIESARVRVVEMANTLIRDPNERPTASVMIKTRGNRSLTRETVQSIQSLVANAVPGLKASQVSVSDTQGRLLTEEYDESSPVGRAGNHFAVRQQVEAYLAKQVRRMLDPVLGLGESTVTVAVELDMDTISSTERTIDSATKVPRSETTKEEVTESVTGSGGTAAGIASSLGGQTNATTTAAATPQNLNNSKIITKETVNDFGEIMRRIEQHAGSIKRMSAAVIVNSRYEGVGAARKVVPRSPEEIDKLQQIVRSALGIQADEDGTRKDEITLVEMPFNEAPILEANLQLEKQEKIHFWLGLARKFGYPALALVILFLFVRSLRRTTVEEMPLGVQVGELDENGQLTSNGDWTGNGKPRVVTVEVLNQLVKENPRNVSHAIRSWMTGAAPGKNN